MGIIFGKFRKKKSTYELLEKLDSEIRSIEEFRRSTEQTHKKIVGRFILISVFVYLLFACIFYFYFFPASMYERLIYIVPLIFAPVIIVTVKKLLTWYYNRKIKKNQKKLANLKEEKKKMLDNVMETETYKVAKKILDKFAPEQIRKPLMYPEGSPMSSKALSPVTPSARTPSQTGLRYRSSYGGQQTTTGLMPRPSMTVSTLSTPLPSRTALLPPPSATGIRSQMLHGQSSSIFAQSGGQVMSTPLTLPRTILPRERTVLDKMVDYLVGDGPSNRYALICKQCHCHNGMALKEEFEYLSFRCCYCHTFNQARKQRPAAPKLEIESKSSPVKKFGDSSSEESSNSDEGSQIINGKKRLISTSSETETFEFTVKTQTQEFTLTPQRLERGDLSNSRNVSPRITEILEKEESNMSTPHPEKHDSSDTETVSPKMSEILVTSEFATTFGELKHDLSDSKTVSPKISDILKTQEFKISTPPPEQHSSETISPKMPDTLEETKSETNPSRGHSLTEISEQHKPETDLSENRTLENDIAETVEAESDFSDIRSESSCIQLKAPSSEASVDSSILYKSEISGIGEHLSEILDIGEHLSEMSGIGEHSSKISAIGDHSVESDINKIKAMSEDSVVPEMSDSSSLGENSSQELLDSKLGDKTNISNDM